MSPGDLKTDRKQFECGGIKVAAVSLGCSKNRVDTEEILGLLSSRGCVLTDNYRLADIIIVNTCSFIESAQQESIETLLEMAAENPGNKPKIVAAGCLVELFGSGIIKSMAEVDGAIGVHSYKHLNRLINMVLKDKRTVIKKSPTDNYRSLASRVMTTPAHSAVVKIGEGCSNNCRYCLIPRIRGPYRSRDPEEIVAEIDGLLQKGAREISLIAQDTTAYGSDFEDFYDLAGLIRKILSLQHKFWLRIMYTYPSRLTDDLIDLIAAEDRICKYLDIPIQHSSDRVLQLMGRKYNNSYLNELFNKLRKRIPQLALRTTCMVGYPGESRREFNNLLQFIQLHRFERLGTFTYSAQEGTDACGSHLKPIPRRIARKRHRELMLNQQRIAEELNKELIGRKMTIIIDKALESGSRWYFGRSEYHAPDVDGGVYVFSKNTLTAGQWFTVTIRAASPYNLLAVPAQPDAAKNNVL